MILLRLSLALLAVTITSAVRAATFSWQDGASITTTGGTYFPHARVDYAETFADWTQPLKRYELFDNLTSAHIGQTFYLSGAKLSYIQEQLTDGSNGIFGFHGVNANGGGGGHGAYERQLFGFLGTGVNDLFGYDVTAVSLTVLNASNFSGGYALNMRMDIEATEGSSSVPSSVPDGSSTLPLLTTALAGACIFRRKLRRV